MERTPDASARYNGDETSKAANAAAAEDQGGRGTTTAMRKNNNQKGGQGDEDDAAVPWYPNGSSTQGFSSSSSSSSLPNGHERRQEQPESPATKENASCCFIARWVLGLALLAAVTFVVVDTTGVLSSSDEEKSSHVKTIVGDFLQWMAEHPKVGAVVFVLGTLCCVLRDGGVILDGVSPIFVCCFLTKCGLCLFFLLDSGWFRLSLACCLLLSVYAAATVLLIPASLLTLGSGFVFACAYGSLAAGTCVGTMIVFAGASIGAILSFLLARFLCHEPVRRLAGRYQVLRALVDGALRGPNGLKIFILLRLSPVAPFNVISYFGGVSGVSFRHYALSVRKIR
jgi:hypothetical protein